MIKINSNRNEQAKILEERLNEATAFLEFPFHEEIKKGKEKILGVDSREAIFTFLEFKKVDYLFNTALHSARVALGMVELGTYLGFNKQVLQILFYSGMDHDVGKISSKIYDAVYKSSKIQDGALNGEFSNEDHNKIRHHVISSASLQEDPLVSKIVLLHHYHQKNSYPSQGEIKKSEYLQGLMNDLTPEIILYSKYLALIDCHDAISTRMKGERIPSLKKTKKILLEEYGELEIKGKKGKDFIEELYNAKLFGKEDPFYPFKEPYSFIKKFQKNLNRVNSCEN